MPQTDPYAAYGGQQIPQQPPASAGADPYAAYGGHAAPPPPAAPATSPSTASLTANPNREGTYKMNGSNGSAGIPFSNVYRAQQNGYKLDPSDEGRFNKDWAAAPGQRNMIAPYSPPWWERARNVVANSAVGHSVEQALPKVADALHLHPTETVNSPTYQSDKNQLLAPQYLMPGTPQSHTGRIVQGALTGAGKLTSGPSMATTAGIAATGGLLAPAAVPATALGLGMTGVGAYGVGKDAYHAGSDYYHGNTAKADEELGEAIPNALMMLPAAGKPIARIGDFAQDKGADVMDSYLKAGKKAYRYDAEPGRSVLEQGPGTSLGFTRQGMSDKISAAQSRVGETIPGIVDSSSASLPRNLLRSGVDNVMQGKKDVLQGPGGNLDLIPPLNDLRSTMSSLVDTPGDASLREGYDAKRNLDKNINWGRDVDAKDATVNNARRELRSNLSGHIYDAEPSLKAPSQQYSGLWSAAKLAEDRTYDKGSPLLNPFRIASMIGSGAVTEGATHSPGLSYGAALATGVLPEVGKLPIVKTGGATALYQTGRGISALGRGLQRAFPSSVRGTGNENGLEYDERSPSSQSDQSANSQFSHNASPALYRMRNLAPEIIRPGDQSRSRIPVGASGRDGVLVRPLGALRAPDQPTPEPTPYNFTSKPTSAVASRAQGTLENEVGSRASLIPQRLLRDIPSSGSAAERAAALRQARAGSYGNIAPSRSFSEPEVIPPARSTNDQETAKLLKPRGRKGPAK